MANIDLPAEPGFGERQAKRADGSMEGRKNEGELDRVILRRAKAALQPMAGGLCKVPRPSHSTGRYARLSSPRGVQIQPNPTQPNPLGLSRHIVEHSRFGDPRAASGRRVRSSARRGEAAVF